MKSSQKYLKGHREELSRICWTGDPPDRRWRAGEAICTVGEYFLLTHAQIASAILRLRSGSPRND